MENYKQKYEIAIKQAKKELKACGDLDCDAARQIFRLFPELKESEDELIWLKKYIKEELDCLSYDIRDSEDCVKLKNLQRSISWLEKQGEQKPIDNALKEAFDKSRKEYSLEEKKEASDYSESIIPTSIAYGESEEEYMLHKIIEAAFIAGQNTKQKPAWSEEDENMYACCEIAIDFFKNLGKNSSGHPHPNYFDLDEKIYPERVIDWLKSIKERYTWKPSDEQIRALEDAIEFLGCTKKVREDLKSLYEQLKKLRKK